EQQNFEVRKNVLKYDEVMNQQRKVIYAERRRILEGENLKDQALDMVRDVIVAYVNGATTEGYAEDWDLEALWTALKTLYPVGIDHETLTHRDADSERDDLTREELLEALTADAERAYAARETELEELAGEGAMRQLERNVLLNVIDRKWREHLYEMDYLKEGIGLRAMAQRDPLVEYQREGFDMFTAMLDGMKEESVGFLFNVTVEAVPAPQVAPVETPEGLANLPAREEGADQQADAEPVATREEPRTAVHAKGIDNGDSDAPALTYTGPSEDGSAEVQRNGGGAQKATAGVPGGGSRRERREAARRQGRGAKPPKSVKKR
ncbi:MAG: preprotein translocase subunit SecA, partial [Mycobacterium sp.]|nr:preprotein translocase subunit SecA [Mycobacterium sp.]